MKEKTVQVAFRLPEWLVQEIDSEAEEMTREMGFKINRTQAVHKLLLRGLSKRQARIIAERMDTAYKVIQEHEEEIRSGKITSPDLLESINTFETSMLAIRDMSRLDPGLFRDGELQGMVASQARLIENIRKRMS